MLNFIPLVILSILFLISGCQADSFQGIPTLEMTTLPSITSPTQGEIKMTPPLPTPDDITLQSLIQRTTGDLASRLGISLHEITLAELTEVEWSDSSLGCPQPGMDYLQVITPGYLIRLEANAQTYEYHSNRDTYFVLCENSPSLPKP